MQPTAIKKKFMELYHELEIDTWWNNLGSAPIM
jgi:hypothetical protein